MPNRLTNVIRTEPFTIQDAATAGRFDYFTLKDFVCPIILFDHVRMKSAGFPPHPHAGLCIFSYLLEDSPGVLRDRDSVSRELLVEPGDLLWFQMASGLIHEENPAVEGVPINLLQVWINLSRDKHGLPPAVFHLKTRDIPEFEAAGNRVRVVLGEWGGAKSPLIPTEPFTFLDATLSGELNLAVPPGWSGIVYLLSGALGVSADGDEAKLSPGEVMGVREASPVRLAPEGGPAQVLYMARPMLRQPLVLQGMLAMEDQEEIDAAKRRFHRGELGEVEPYARVVNPGARYIPAGQDPDLAVTPFPKRQTTVRHYDEGWWKLHLQYCRYVYSDGETAYGYRFVWESPEGREEPYRTGGHIPYMEYVTELLAAATREGWGNLPYRDSF